MFFSRTKKNPKTKKMALAAFRLASRVGR